MRLYMYGWQQAFLAIFFLGSATSTSAEVTVTPDALTIALTRDAEMRTLIVQSDQVVNRLKFATLDLSRTDGVAVFSASRIQVTASPDTKIAANDFVSIPITFDAAGLQRSGEYNGVLLMLYDGGQQKIPLLVRVKDPAWLPFLWLAAGVGLGISVSNYRKDGLVRDEIVVQVGRLRNQMRSDQELAQSFQSRVDEHLVDVDAALESKRWDAARSAIDAAQAVWDKWRRGRADWLAQLTYQKKLMAKVEEMIDPDTLYQQAVKTALEGTEQEAADKARPQDLRQTLLNINQQVDRYGQGKQELDALDQRRTDAALPGYRDDFWRQESQDLRRRLNALSPTDEAAFTNWQVAIATKLTQLIEELERLQSLESGLPTVGGRGVDEQIVLTVKRENIPPPCKSVKETDPAQSAKSRLQAFSWLYYAISLFLLAGAGFNQLYVSKPTFGANPFPDYFALIAWGFGSEVTRESIAKVLQDWRSGTQPGVEEAK